MSDFETSGPVVLFGRGGSGTRLLSQMALEAGLFLGSELNPTNDSMAWKNIIYDLAQDRLSQETDQHQPILNAGQQLRDHAQAFLDSPDYSGALWGWKLPESILILPELLAAFPNVKFVHLVRHPLTCCLRGKHVTSRRSHVVGKAVLTKADAHYAQDPRLHDLDDTFRDNAASWRFQIDRVLEFQDNLDRPDRLLTLRFEDLVSSWEGSTEHLKRFIGLADSKAKSPEIDRERASVFDDPPKEAHAVWQFCKASAHRFGYDVDDHGRPIIAT